MFWIRAFLNLRLIAGVLSIFYVSRGVGFSQIMLLGLFWAGAGLLFEIPSSYLADRWGRKKTILLGVVFALTHIGILFFAEGFVWLAIATVFHGLQWAAMSGTDEALIYDTQKELGKETATLGRLGQYRSAHHVFKIATPIIAAVIAKDLLPWQFTMVLLLDFVGMLVSLVIALRIVEPHHKMDVEKLEAGIILDAWNLIKKRPVLFKIILNKEMVFFATFIVWTYFQAFFVDLGLSILLIGVLWGLSHVGSFLWNWYIERLHKGRNIAETIHRFNQAGFVVSAVLVVLLYAYPVPLLTYIVFIIFLKTASCRVPLFAELFHKQFNSYNRASTMSLVNLVHNAFEYPILLVSAAVVAYDVRAPYVMALFMMLFAIVFLKIPKKTLRPLPIPD